MEAEIADSCDALAVDIIHHSIWRLSRAASIDLEVLTGGDGRLQLPLQRALNDTAVLYLCQQRGHRDAAPPSTSVLQSRD